ncbi:MAG: acyl--CoA ligase, partial [Clostridia bacterium]|nr:acyl--CoA ligase [Clostridia bacterium]
MSEAVVKTGYPSIDKPWDKYFRACDNGNVMKVPEDTMFNYLKKCNADYLDGYALDFFGHKITYRELFDRVELVANSMRQLGIQPGEVIGIITVNAVESYELMYGANRCGAIFDYISCLADHKALVHYFQDNEAKKIFVLDLFADKVMKAAKEAGFADKLIVFDLADEMPAITRVG